MYKVYFTKSKEYKYRKLEDIKIAKGYKAIVCDEKGVWSVLTQKDIPEKKEKQVYTFQMFNNTHTSGKDTFEVTNVRGLDFPYFEDSDEEYEYDDEYAKVYKGRTTDEKYLIGELDALTLSGLAYGNIDPEGYLESLEELD